MEIYENLDLNDLDGEIWKSIKNFEDYQISNLGRVKSFKCGKERILKQNKNKHGYLYVSLSKDGKEKPKLIHRLLFETFNNYSLKKNEIIHHLDFTKDNFLNNLQVMTKSEHHSLHNKGKIASEKSKKLMSENHADVKGENNQNSILTEQDIILIKIDLCGGLLTQREIAKKFGVSYYTISDIKRRRTWNHI